MDLAGMERLAQPNHTVLQMSTRLVQWFGVGKDVCIANVKLSRQMQFPTVAIYYDSQAFYGYVCILNDSSSVTLVVNAMVQQQG